MGRQSPVLGYNTNVRHGGKLFHIQTEDSGIKHPHIITHLFADGGRIVSTKKTTYKERLDEENLHEIVKGLMKGQHKAMFIALRDGEFDEAEGIVKEEKKASGFEEAAQPAAVAKSPYAHLPEITLDQILVDYVAMDLMALN